MNTTLTTIDNETDNEEVRDLLCKIDLLSPLAIVHCHPDDAEDTFPLEPAALMDCLEQVEMHCDDVKYEVKVYLVILTWETYVAFPSWRCR